MSWGRGLAAATVLACTAGLLASGWSLAASDVFDNVAPASPLPAGLTERYPLGNYALDVHFPAVEASLTGGVDASGVAPTIAHFLANTLWLLTAFLADTLVTLFVFAFSLDLVRGSEATGGAGALEPVGQAIRALYSDVLGQPWLVVAVTLVGVWAIWRGLVLRRYTDTAAALGLSLVYIVIALAFVTQPERTVGQAVRWTNQLSLALLSLSNQGDPSGAPTAKQAAADQLFSLLVHEPWTVLQFGGRDHCVRPGTGSTDTNPVSLPVRPLARDAATDARLAAQLNRGIQLHAAGKTCINNHNKYSDRFLRLAPGSDERNAEYQALNTGDTSRLPDSSGGYRLSVADKPAADAMEEGGQYQRLLIALVVFAGELGAFLLLGALVVGVTLAQVLLLLLLAFAPVALILATIPGRGHTFFQGWITRLAGFLLRKAAYSLILAVLLAVNAALAQATSNLGWLLSFGLQALLFWTVFLYRHQLTGQLLQATAGPADVSEAGRFAALYTTTRLATRRLRRGSHTGRPAGDRAAPHRPEPPVPPPASTQPSVLPLVPIAPDPAVGPPGAPGHGDGASIQARGASPPGSPPAGPGRQAGGEAPPDQRRSDRFGQADAETGPAAQQSAPSPRRAQSEGEGSAAAEGADPPQRQRSDDNPLRSGLEADQRRLEPRDRERER